MAPKHALLSSNSGRGGINQEGDGRCSSWLLGAGMVAACKPRKVKGSRAPRGTPARCFVAVSAVLMLLMLQSCLAAADGKTHGSTSNLPGGSLTPHCKMAFIPVTLFNVVLLEEHVTHWGDLKCCVINSG